ncbi:MAG TPA: hypothetical protein VD791_10025 [Burkholderiales bacterium]|nr:hypothetical protein [Burkholderiales bacterium]
MKKTAPSAVLLLCLLALPAAANDDCTAHTADDARGSGEDVRVEADPPALDGAPSEAGRQRRLGVNLFLCANGLPGCDESLLSPEERARYRVNRPAQQ